MEFWVSPEHCASLQDLVSQIPTTSPFVVCRCLHRIVEAGQPFFRAVVMPHLPFGVFLAPYLHFSPICGGKSQPYPVGRSIKYDILSASPLFRREKTSYRTILFQSSGLISTRLTRWRAELRNTRDNIKIRKRAGCEVEQASVVP